MTKVLVTGSKGFIGRNLVTRLLRHEDVTVEEFDSSMKESELASKIDDCSVIFHLAGVNRPNDESDFQTVNAGLTNEIVNQVSITGAKPLIVFASSIQADLDNPYGRSKLDAEEILIAANESLAIPIAIYRLPGVFGKWSRPNYNTVVATFCHNIARGLEITVSDPEREIELAYVDDVVECFAKHIDRHEEKSQVFHCVEKTYAVKLSELAERIRNIHNSRESLQMIDFDDELNQCLFPTYLSFVENDQWAKPVQMRTDDRGWLFELIKSPHFGQIFVSTTKPGVTRGNHYHDSKVEKFCLIKGKGLIRFRHLANDEIVEYPVSDENVRIVDIPPGYTHSIENVGDVEMIVLFWASEIFDSEVPDTYWEPVLK